MPLSADAEMVCQIWLLETGGLAEPPLLLILLHYTLLHWILLIYTWNEL